MAKLSSLSLSEAEADGFARELARIVGYVSELDSLDTTDVPPTAHVQLERMPLRPDEPRPCLSHEEALAQAPEAVDGGFAVPTFVE
jgi:aspartyl-tRNA(Asn)/glutamyl-tRNA(Gln) amidotransferase subunit C